MSGGVPHLPSGSGHADGRFHQRTEGPHVIAAVGHDHAASARTQDTAQLRRSRLAIAHVIALFLPKALACSQVRVRRVLRRWVQRHTSILVDWRPGIPSVAMPRIDRASRLVNAPATRVFDSFVNQAALEAWLPPDGMTGRFERFDPRPGGSYRLV